jgi:hypothetical protein
MQAMVQQAMAQQAMAQQAMEQVPVMAVLQGMVEE